MLFAGDVYMNLMGLGDPVGFESLNDGRASQRKLASLSFDAAGFGHGAPIARDASTRFRDEWGQEIGRLTWETPALGPVAKCRFGSMLFKKYVFRLALCCWVVLNRLS